MGLEDDRFGGALYEYALAHDTSSRTAQEGFGPGRVPAEQVCKARRTPLGSAQEVRQWWRRARVRQRKTTLVTIPSNHPRIAEKMTIQTSDTVDEPTTQLNST